jgi:short-subunit dehydrogenase
MESAHLAVVTGPSSGIGLELTRLFAGDGYDMVVVADEAAIHDVARELADAGGHIEPVRVDLRDDDAVQHVYDIVSDGGARVPAAIAFNVGIGRAGRFVDGDLQADLDIVSVTALMPGPTDTAFFHRAAMKDTPLARLHFKDDRARTARQGYDAMMRGEQKVVASSLTSKLMGAVSTVLPDSLKAMANRLIATRSAINNAVRKAV